jgi:hypothetical protein
MRHQLQTLAFGILLLVGCSSVRRSAPSVTDQFSDVWGSEDLCAGVSMDDLPRTKNVKLKELFGAEIESIAVVWYSPHIANRDAALSLVESRLEQQPFGGTIYAHIPWANRISPYVKAVVKLKGGGERRLEVAKVVAACWEDRDGIFWWAELDPQVRVPPRF